VFWNFTLEQTQNPDKLVEYLEQACCRPGSSRETQLFAVSWGLAHAYRALFDIVQCSKGEGGGKQTMGTAAAPTPVTGTVATQTLAMGTAAKRENQPVQYQLPLHRRGNTQKNLLGEG